MTILGCTGHQAIPPEARDFIRGGVSSVIRDNAGADLAGVCSLAAGADQIFADAILDAGGDLHVVVPSNHYELTFEKKERAAYFELLGHARTVEDMPFDYPSEKAFFAAGKRVAERCEVLVAVWDGAAARGLGGTADVVSHARSLGRRVEVVWPEGVVRDR